ncbi:hypothetical protein GCM10009764_06080 [Nocardia ninae]|uniref:RNA polymerase sigma factor n=1 Tax=Nocardia ninae NBRC 108245 TaxID=1210091 RepID=A0A511ML73_9NOCA|nr:hypothetical protein NN4_54070 [Nocardia ninae NBRC 108245]
MDTKKVQKLIARAGSAVVREWPGVIDAEDLGQELWLWILRSRSVQDKLTASDDYLSYRLLVQHGHKIAAAEAEKNVRFATNVQYSTEDVRKALEGELRWAELLDDLTSAMEVIREKHPQYADAIRKRFGEKQKGVDYNAVKRGVIAITDEMNRQARVKRAEYGDGPGARRVVSNAAAQTASKGNE